MKPLNLRIINTIDKIAEDIRMTEDGKVSVNNKLMLRLERQLDMLATINIVGYTGSIEHMPSVIKALLHSKHTCKDSEHPNAS